MRKIGMMLAMLVCAVMAQAGEYAYLVFVNQSNDTTAHDRRGTNGPTIGQYLGCE